MTKKQIETFRNQLQDKLVALRKPALEASEIQVQQTADPIDDAQSQCLRELALQVMASGWETTRAVESALERIGTGEYGWCEGCGESIKARRLQAVPWATRCVACQEETESVLV